MARDPKKWAGELRFYDITNSGEELDLNELADLISEAQEDGAAEWRARSETLTDNNEAMAAEIAELRARLSNVASTAQAASNGWEPAQGLEAIYHIATTEPENAKPTDPLKCYTCQSEALPNDIQCLACIERGELPF